MVNRPAAILDRVSAPLGVFRTGVVGQARRRQRRRERRLAAIAILTVAILAAVILAPSATRQPRGSAAARAFGHGAALVAAARVLSQTPYLGVSCPPVGNSIACDRVGLAINLRRPATAVTASVAGWLLPLTDRGDVPAVRGLPRTEFDGFLQPAGIVHHLHVIPDGGPNFWYGSKQPQVDIRLLINYGHADLVTTETTVVLSTGWG